MAMGKISEDAMRTALVWMAGAKSADAVRAAEEIRLELERMKLPPSLADYDRMKTPEAERPATMRRSKPSRKRPFVAGNFAHPADVPPSKSKRRATKKEQRAHHRDVVFERSGGRCEGPRDHWPLNRTRCTKPAAEFMHIFGRGAGRFPESERSCAAACRDCHKLCGLNKPTGTAWWMYWSCWLTSQGFTVEAAEALKRASFVETRAGLPAAPKIASTGGST